MNGRAPDALGSHRVLQPPGAMPQTAWILDATPEVRSNEILCEVEALNIDSASFRQIVEASDGDEQRVTERILALVAERGKHHNPITGSGGMFLGRVSAVGDELARTASVRPGDRIASLVSLTLTPLRLEAVERIDMTTGRVWVRGTAILFASGIYAKLPDDLPDDVALAVFDVAGAPAQVRRLVRPGQTVVVLGADGKSGILSCAQAKERAGPGGRVIGIAPDPATPGARLLIDQGYVDAFLAVDARDALAVRDAVAEVAPELADVVVNCVNVPGTELSSVLATKEDGTVYFFSMSTSFTAAALGAEGVGKDVTMIVGNGYAKGHAETALATLRERPPLLAYFTGRYGSPLSPASPPAS